jgi:glycosyltransferase involved in cell wall biosynthesis
MPADIESARRKFNLPERGVAFVTIGEPTSDFERKNPLAVIQTFKKALHGASDAHLVVRINNAGIAANSRTMIEIEHECANDRRIHLSRENLTYKEVLSLYASCDVFVALHRSEGLGFGMIEAMTLGKPVIATAWSGNMTFMNHTNSCLVSYNLIPVNGTVPLYNKKFLGKTALWAEPDLRLAGEWMKRLWSDSALRIKIGKKAAADIATFQKQAKHGNFVDELCNLLFYKNLLGWETNRQSVLQRYRRPAWSTRVSKETKRLLDQHVLWRFQRLGS